MKRYLLLSVAATVMFAQSPQDLDGNWQGTLVAPSGNFNLLLRVAKGQDGIFLGSLTSAAQGTFPIDHVTVSGETVRFEVPSVAGHFEGAMNPERTQLKGTWSIAATSLPLELTRMAPPPRPATPPKLPEAQVKAIGVPLDLNIPIAPTPFLGSDGKTHLVYELHITNPTGLDLHLNRVEILAGDTTLASFAGVELNNLLLRPGVDVIDKRVIGGGLRAIVFLWVTLEAGASVPGSLRHRLGIDEYTFDGGKVAVLTQKPLVLGPFLRGTDWLAGNGPSNTSVHRRALQPVEGKLQNSQRYAIDWIKQGTDGMTFTGDQKDNKSYHAYGNEILAVADAIVSETKDGIPENEPGVASRAVPMTLETIGGNHVVLDLGGGRFAFYAHMQPGSVRVKVGDRVRRGQVLGLVGNTGNSTEPHLHFDVSDGNSPLGSEGVPYVLESFELLGSGAPEQKRNALPLDRDRVRFPI